MVVSSMSLVLVPGQGLDQSKAVVVLRKQLWAPVTPLPSAIFFPILPSTLKTCVWLCSVMVRTHQTSGAEGSKEPSLLF